MLLRRQFTFQICQLCITFLFLVFALIQFDAHCQQAIKTWTWFSTLSHIMFCFIILWNERVMIYLYHPAVLSNTWNWLQRATVFGILMANDFVSPGSFKGTNNPLAGKLVVYLVKYETPSYTGTRSSIKVSHLLLAQVICILLGAWIPALYLR